MIVRIYFDGDIFEQEFDNNDFVIEGGRKDIQFFSSTDEYFDILKAVCKQLVDSEEFDYLPKVSNLLKNAHAVINGKEYIKEVYADDMDAALMVFAKFLEDKKFPDIELEGMYEN